jgi:hypothetical protein
MPAKRGDAMSTNTNDDRQRVEDLIRRLRTEQSEVRSHTHRSVEEAIRDLRIGPVERFLLWMSKTDYYVLQVTPFQARQTLVGLGMMVVFTSLLAFSSALYALSTTLVSPDSPARWPIAITLAAIYAYGILIIDREIVGSVSNRSLVFRLVFAVLIATAVSWPVKLKFFEGRVQVEINRMIDERNADKLVRIDQLKGTGEQERQDLRTALQQRLGSLDSEIGVLDREISREAENMYCGPLCQGYRKQKAELMDQRLAIEQQLQESSLPISLPEDVQREVNRLEAEVAEEHRISYDFLTKWEALARIKQQSGSDYEVLSGFLLAFFMLLEMVPLALKWSLGKTEYHYYLETRMNINNQKITSLHNLFMGLLQSDPHSVLDVIPLEITDIIAAHIEDEAKGPASEPDMAGLADVLRARQAGTPPANGEDQRVQDTQADSDQAQRRQDQPNRQSEGSRVPDRDDDETLPEPEAQR